MESQEFTEKFPRMKDLKRGGQARSLAGNEMRADLSGLDNSQILNQTISVNDRGPNFDREYLHNQEDNA